MGSDSLIMLAGLGVGLYVVWKSGILSNLGSGGASAGDTTTTPPPTDTTGGTTTPPPTGTGGDTGGVTIPPQPTQGGNDTCHSVYNGSCNVECQSGATQLCQACLVACGQGSLPPTGSLPQPQPQPQPYPYPPPTQYPYPYPYPTPAPTPTPTPIPVSQPNPTRCHSVYNGKCTTECTKGGDCQGCLAACGPNSMYATTTIGYYAAIANSQRRQRINAYYANMNMPQIAIA